MKSRNFLYALISSFLLAALFLSGCGNTKMADDNGENEEATSEQAVVRIGYQKNCPLLILKSLGTLEKRLEKVGFTVEWKEFQAGPALVEALNAGSIDIGRTGNTPPIFSQAAGAPFVYVAAGAPKFEGSGILVAKDSEITSLEDLKGKKIGFAKGSSSHYLIVKALEKAGLSYDDITPAFLQPGDARVAFEQGNIDAWTVWDPFAASAQVGSDARLLVNGEGLTTDRDFFLAHEAFASQHQDVLDVIIEEVGASSVWSNTHHDELVDLLVPALKLDEETIRMAITRRTYGVDPITEDIIEEQQGIADLFYSLDIIPTKVNVRDVMKESNQ
ncbi:sulfonate ABC transporter substrate-binding protein [Mesobacillus harenae]|uniref:sulfonate ABC transporter substrate-binding protein n=1 Tax=Mesobacillus harenae TaxID=2213203 RepID=UPI0015808433|nr:sulfonate ABC transporter substrate-binding protein [Mesobacillus harenae]